MPTYQYRCKDCGNELEVFQKFSEDSLTICPSCEGSLRKVFNPVGIVFKGSGFYSTDNHTAGSSTTAGESTKHSESEKPAAKTGPTSAETTKDSGTTTGSSTTKAETPAA